MRELELCMDKSNIILIGFMGTGKSTVGKVLAKALDWNFIDTDLEIQEITNSSIPDIFRRHGETRFRSEEENLVKRLAGLEKHIIATGGGTVLHGENWKELAHNGVMVALYAPLEIIYERIGNKNDRPLLKGDPEEVKVLWEKRQPIYAQADVTIDTTDKSVEEVVEEILRVIEGEK